MDKFQFSKKSEPILYNGPTFYRLYKDADFLSNTENVKQILCRGYELRQYVKKMSPGDYKVVDNMKVAHNVPLLIKKTGPNIPLEGFEFTYNRLVGLTAAYAYENRQRFPVLPMGEATTIGLEWDIESPLKCQLYLSAASGSEHFEQFSYFPLVSALRKLQLNKIDLNTVMKIAKVKNGEGKSMASVLMQNYTSVVEMWPLFKGSDVSDLKALVVSAPPQLMALFNKV